MLWRFLLRLAPTAAILDVLETYGADIYDVPRGGQRKFCLVGPKTIIVIRH